MPTAEDVFDAALVQHLMLLSTVRWRSDRWASGVIFRLTPRMPVFTVLNVIQTIRFRRAVWPAGAPGRKTVSVALLEFKASQEEPA